MPQAHPAAADASTPHVPGGALEFDPTTIVIDYTNYRGERARRRILPNRLWFGAADWHPEPQWILDAWDIQKGAIRSFAMRDIHSWEPDSRP
jgi:predicted DNA-binding transcriptional regulator YafY